MRKITGLMVFGLLLAFFAALLQSGVLPQKSLIMCRDLDEPQLLVYNPNVYEGLVFTISACGLNNEHTYSIYDNNLGAMNITFTGFKWFYHSFVLYEEDFHEDTTLQIWLFDVSIQEMIDTKMLIII